MNLQQVLEQSTTERLDYRPCVRCERHPLYPSILPATLHVDGECLICGEKSESPRSSIERLV